MGRYNASSQVVGSTSNARRVTLVVLLVVAVVVAVAPALLLQRAAAQRAGDSAHRALTTYALAHNGDHSLDAAAADVLPTLTSSDLGNGRTRLSRLSPEGDVCWVVVVEDGRAAMPRKGVMADCTAP